MEKYIDENEKYTIYVVANHMGLSKINEESFYGMFSNGWIIMGMHTNDVPCPLDTFCTYTHFGQSHNVPFQSHTRKGNFH